MSFKKMRDAIDRAEKEMSKLSVSNESKKEIFMNLACGLDRQFGQSIEKYFPDCDPSFFDQCLESSMALALGGNSMDICDE